MTTNHHHTLQEIDPQGSHQSVAGLHLVTQPVVAVEIEMSPVALESTTTTILKGKQELGTTH